MINYLRNLAYNYNRYRSHPEAVVVACYFNPQQSTYRLKAFKDFYESIRHLNHYIIEGVIGDSRPQLTGSNVHHVYTKSLLWHKESLLNLAVDRLSAKYKYVFWLDADVRFTNLNWMVDGVKEFKRGANILQPFEYCYHLDQYETEPDYDVKEAVREFIKYGTRKPQMWRSFCANCVDDDIAANSKDYNTHGHVGFAWAAKRSVITKVRLYDKALIGGADHIIAHAAAGQIPCSCINKSFTADLDNVYDWSKRFSDVVKGKIAYVKGNLYHTWHGDIEKRQYLKRIQDFTPVTKEITEKDANGLYVTKGPDIPYIKDYFDHREMKGPVTKPTVKSTYRPTVVRSNSSPVTHTDHYHYIHTGGSSSKSSSSAGYDNNATETCS
jgi:hypothetical protein